MYKKWISLLRDYFGISRKEARGALVLMVFCGIFVWAPFIFRRTLLPLFTAQKPPWNPQQLDSLVAELNRENAPQFTRKKWAPIDAAAITLAPFNPNTASAAALEKLGIPAFLANRIVRFRDKGGRFRKKEDLARIYDFPPELYSRLESYIQLPVSEAREPGKPAFRYPERDRTFAKQQPQSFDINTADTTQLIRLKGIGSKLSVRILKFRNALGGFYSPDQYSEIYGLDSLALSELRRFAKIGSPVKKININTATAGELGAHSYLRNRKIVQVILSYRQQHGPFQTAEDLKKTMVVDDPLLNKLKPYLAF